MTSPRTPQLLGWTVPNHVKAWVEGVYIRVACMYFHSADTTTTSVPLGDDDAPTIVGHFLRDHAHGEQIEYRPLSEVLPETPEPPRTVILRTAAEVQHDALKAETLRLLDGLTDEMKATFRRLFPKGLDRLRESDLVSAYNLVVRSVRKLEVPR